MRVKINTTLKCNDDFIVAGEILDSSKQEIPDFITDLVEAKSMHVTLLEEIPIMVVEEHDTLDEIIDKPDSDTVNETVDDPIATDLVPENFEKPDDSPKIKRRGKN